MIIKKMALGVYGANCYIVTCKETKKTAVIDPGGNADEILKYIDENSLEISFILLTHGHGDHIGAVPEIIEKTGVPVYIHSNDDFMLKDADKNLSRMMWGPDIQIEESKLLNDGDNIELGRLNFHIIHTPGHTPGCICVKVEDIIFTGDTLFAGSIGRTDLEGGSYEEIIHSISEKLLVLDDKMKVLPGHGPASTIEKERRSNPFI